MIQLLITKNYFNETNVDLGPLFLSISELFDKIANTTIAKKYADNYKTATKYADLVALVSMCTSVFMMVALTLERHFAICSPHAYRIHIRTTPRWKHLAMYIVPVTALAIFFNVPMLLNALQV